MTGIRKTPNPRSRQASPIADSGNRVTIHTSKPSPATVSRRLGHGPASQRRNALGGAHGSVATSSMNAGANRSGRPASSLAEVNDQIGAAPQPAEQPVERQDRDRGRARYETLEAQDLERDAQRETDDTDLVPQHEVEALEDLL